MPEILQRRRKNPQFHMGPDRAHRRWRAKNLQEPPGVEGPGAARHPEQAQEKAEQRHQTRGADGPEPLEQRREIRRRHFLGEQLQKASGTACQ